MRRWVIGTLGVGEPGHVEATGLTSPDPVTLHQAFRRFVNEGFSACAIEASSIGLAEHRLAAARIDVADDAEVGDRDDRDLRIHHRIENCPDFPHTRSITMAIPCPTPMHIVARA
jgi:UDP-N-acetylmuramyl tripeptide synthase